MPVIGRIQDNTLMLDVRCLDDAVGSWAAQRAGWQTNMIIATAGHIDHGKTALVKALTGIDTDRLPEEKQRGMSIDLGFAYHPLSSGQVLGFVDVPGHERFIRNMPRA